VFRYCRSVYPDAVGVLDRQQVGVMFPLSSVLCGCLGGKKSFTLSRFMFLRLYFDGHFFVIRLHRVHLAAAIVRLYGDA
jgi:hypothetical protein